MSRRTTHRRLAWNFHRARPVAAAGAALFAIGALAACSSSSSTASQSNASEPKVTLRLADYLASNDPWTVWAEKLAAEVSADTDGAVKIEVYPNGELVSQADYLQAIRSGSVDMTVGGVSELDTITPAAAGLNMSDIPDRDQTWPQADAITLSAQVRDIQNQALKSAGVQILSTCTEGFSAFVTKTPVATVAQFKGMKMRVAAPADGDLVKALGTDPTELAIGDTYEALELNTVAGSFAVVPDIYTNQWYKVAKYVDLIPIRMANESLVINSKSLDKLSASEQQILEKDSAGATQSCDNGVEAAAEQDEQLMKAAGATLVTPTNLSGFLSVLAADRNQAELATPLAKKLSALESQIVSTTK